MSHDMQSELTKHKEMMGILFDFNPDGVCIGDSAGRIISNPAALRILPGPYTPAQSMEELSLSYGFFLADGKTPHPVETLPLMRAISKRETVRDYELFCRSPVLPEGVWISATASPLPNGGGVAVFRDITERKRLEESLADRNIELSRQTSENRDLIERLRLSVEELSTPVLELGDDVLVLPVVGVVDTVRSMRMMDKVLSEVVSRRCRFVIIDITGVDVIDTSTADRFLKLARAVALLGAECVMSGVQPSVAQTMNDLGVSFSGIVTKRNLKRALDHCIGKQREERQRIAS